MARLLLATAAGIELGVDYDQRSGKASAMYCLSTGAAQIGVGLLDGSTRSVTVAAGETLLPLPANKVTVVLFEGSLSPDGLASLTLRTP